MATIVTVTLTVQDAKRKAGRIVFYTDMDSAYMGWGNITNDKMGDIIAYFREVARRIDLTLKTRVTAINFSIGATLPAGIKAAPLPDSDVEEVARLVYGDVPGANPGVAWENSLPGFNHELFGSAQSVPYPYTGEAEMAYLALLLTFPDEAIDWPGELGGITDSRGYLVRGHPTFQRKFRR